MTTGKDHSDFPGAFIPFDAALGQVPSVPIDSSPSRQICINEDWLPFVLTCLKTLSRPETWDDTYDNSVIAASEFAALVGNIIDGCGVIVPSIGCFFGSFLDLDYGFVPTPGAGCVATWTHGVGWQMCADSTPQGFLQIKREFGNTTLIREVHLKMTTNVPYLLNVDVTLYYNGTFTNIISDHATTGPTLDYNVTGLTEIATAMFITVVETLGGAAADTVITDFGLCYTGAFPLVVTEDAFTHVFDFTVDDGGFTPESNPTYAHTGTWVSGVGWQSDANSVMGGTDEVLIIDKFNSARIITSVSIEWSTPDASCGGYRHFVLDLSGSSVFDLPLDNGAGSFVQSGAPFVTSDEIHIVPTTAGACHTPGTITVTRLVVSGLGSDPY